MTLLQLTKDSMLLPGSEMSRHSKEASVDMSICVGVCMCQETLEGKEKSWMERMSEKRKN